MILKKVFFFVFFSLLLPRDTAITNVHLVLNSHNDLIWVETLDHIYNGTVPEGFWTFVCVKCIFNSTISMLSSNPTRTFTMTEMYFLLMYYQKNLGNENGRNLKKLIENKQMIIGQSGLSIPDQATAHYDDIIDQITYGRRKIFELFGVKQEDGWALDTFGGSYAYKMILRQFGVKNMIIDRISESERQNRMQTKSTQFYSGTEDFMVHVLPYLYGTKANSYQSNEEFLKLINLIQGNLQDPTEILLILSNDFKPWGETEFKLVENRIEYFNKNTSFNVFYSSAHNYFEKLYQKAWNFSYSFENITDFYPMEDFKLRPWVGFFSSRPNIKLIVKRFGLLSRSLKNLFSSFQIIKTQNETIKISDDLYQACVDEFERHLGFLTHHDVVTGTLSKISEADVWRLTKIVESNCREQLDKSEISQKNVFCNLLNNTDTCIIDFFEKDLNFTQEFRNYKKKMLLRIFNPAQSKEDMISFRIPDFNMNVAFLNGTSIDSDTFCEEINGVDCRLYFKTIFPGFEFIDLFLSFANDSASINRNMTNISAEEMIDLNFEFPAKLKIEKILSRFSYVNSEMTKNFTFDLMYYEDNRLKNCKQFNDGGFNCIWGKCDNYYEYSGAYAMRLEDGMPIYFNSEMNMSAFYYKTKFFTKIIIQLKNNTIIYSLTFNTDYNKKPESLFIETWIFLNDNLDLGFPITSGKEIILVIKDENLHNNNSFITDSNGLYHIKREKKTPYNNNSRDIPMNFYPIVSKISIRDNYSSQALTILNDRAQGATSFREGEIQILLARYYRTDDWLGICENYFTQEKIYINHQIIFHKFDMFDKNESFADIINRKNFIYLPFLGTHDYNYFFNMTNEEDSQTNLFSSLPQYIKINFHPLSIKKNVMLIRIQDLFHESNDETHFHMLKIQENLQNRCNETNESCKFINFICENVSLDGIDPISKSLTGINDLKEFTQAILTTKCQENIINGFNHQENLELETNYIILIVCLAVGILLLVILLGVCWKHKLKRKKQDSGYHPKLPK